MMEEPSALVVMRLDQMHRVHPDQDSSKVCSVCGEPVGIYPSGQTALRAHPNIKIICFECTRKQEDIENPPLAIPAGSIEEIAQEIRDSVDKKE
jgi:hypothetical protein